MSEKEYIPFGDEWVKECMKLRKSDLVAMLRDSLMKVRPHGCQERPICEVCGVPGCIEFRGRDFHSAPSFGSKKCDYTGTPPFADAAWAGKENDESKDPMCEWCAGTGHPHADESYGFCECPALKANR